MSFWQKISPKRAAKDFAGEWQGDSPHRWPVLGVAIAITGSLLWMLIPAEQQGFLPRPNVIYISTWEEGRSDEEIIASNIANQKRKDIRAERQARRDEIRKDMYRTLGRATGVDVDAMEAKIKADEAEDAAQATENAAPPEVATSTTQGEAVSDPATSAQ